MKYIYFILLCTISAGCNAKTIHATAELVHCIQYDDDISFLNIKISRIDLAIVNALHDTAPPGNIINADEFWAIMIINARDNIEQLMRERAELAEQVTMMRRDIANTCGRMTYSTEIIKDACHYPDLQKTMWCQSRFF